MRSEEELPLREVWDTLDRYIVSCMEQNRGLVVPNFGRFGWQVSHRVRKTYVGPYFDFLDSFSRRYRASLTRSQAAALEADLCRWEEFNFSKAALCFSRTLTKDHVSLGLRILIHQIGQAIAQGRPLSLDFHVGTLMKQGSGLRFQFFPDVLHTMENENGDNAGTSLRPRLRSEASREDTEPKNSPAAQGGLVPSTPTPRGAVDRGARAPRPVPRPEPSTASPAPATSAGDSPVSSDPTGVTPRLVSIGIDSSAVSRPRSSPRGSDAPTATATQTSRTPTARTPQLRGSIWTRPVPKCRPANASKALEQVEETEKTAGDGRERSVTPREGLKVTAKRPARPQTCDVQTKKLNTPRPVRPRTSDVAPPPRPQTCDVQKTNLTPRRGACERATHDEPPRSRSSRCEVESPRSGLGTRPRTSLGLPSRDGADVSLRPLLCTRGKQGFHREPDSSPRCYNIKECLDQHMAMHLKSLEQRARYAIEKRQDDVKLKQKQEELEQRRARLLRLREHSDFLMKQMEDKVLRRRADVEAERESVVTTSSPSTAPALRKAAVTEHRRDLLTSHEKEDCASQITEDLAQDQLLAGRPRPAVLLGNVKARQELRDCLHAQIEVKKKQREEQRKERLEFEVSWLEHETLVMAQQSSRQKAAKKEEKESLRQAWSQDCKLKAVHRRIEALEQGKVPQAPLFAS